MGNVMKVIGPTWTEADQENLLLSELSKLPLVELQKVNWCLSQDILQNFPPIPPHWLRPADAHGTTNTMLRCYKEGALMILPKVLTMIGRDDQVSHLPKNLPSIQALPTLGRGPSPAPGFVRSQRRKLISRMQRPEAVLRTLQDRDILTAANAEAIRIFAVLGDKNRALVDLVLRKQVKAQKEFYHALNQSEPFFLQELNSDCSCKKDPSNTCDLLEMLEFLDSEELRTFQWLAGLYLSSSDQLENADTLTTGSLLEEKFGPHRAAKISSNILLRMVPLNSLCLQSGGTGSETPETNTSSTPELSAPHFRVHQDGDKFRLTCSKSGLSCCGLTGLRLEGVGDVVYQTVPWDVDFLASKGLRPAGPLFKFTLLSGRFHRLHLLHCQLPSDGSLSLLSVAHVTKEHVDFLPPDDVTEDHVVVGISGFSCFGLVAIAVPPEQSAKAKQALPACGAIKGLVLLFHEQAVDPEMDSSLFVLLLPSNVVTTQVIKDWKTRNRRARFVEVTSRCELIQNQMYKLKAQPATLIQPESATFLNYSDYHNFVSSFEVRLKADERKLDIELWTKVSSLTLIGWLLGPSENCVWRQNIQLKGDASASEAPVSEADTPLLLLKTLNSLRKDDFKTFRHSLSLQPASIPLFQLEEAERSRVVELMVQRYNAEGAKELMREILRRMGNNQQAAYLETPD